MQEHHSINFYKHHQISGKNSAGNTEQADAGASQHNFYKHHQISGKRVLATLNRQLQENYSIKFYKTSPNIR
jgi:hypothetical protein